MEVHSIPIPEVFHPAESEEEKTCFTKLFVLPRYRNVSFARTDNKTTSAIAIADANQPTISDMRITTADGSTVAVSKGLLDGIELDSSLLNSGTAPIHLGSSVASLLDTKTLLVWSIGGNAPWKKLLRFRGDILDIVDVDSEIGMILVKEMVDPCLAPLLRAYWIA